MKRKKNEHRILLTNNVQINRVTPDWLGRYLALVYTGVSLLCPFDLQRPFIYVSMVRRLKSKICRIGVRANG